MSREPKPAAPLVRVSALYPYSAGPSRLTLNNLAHFNGRVKKLPPDANCIAVPNTRLYQFSEKVCFGCIKCRRDNILSDVVAVDQRQRIMLCASCFSRIIRPRTYRPSRVVPFPSLLSWLDYKPHEAMSVPEDVTERTAEAVLPSGDRIASPRMVTGDALSRLNALPAIGMNIGTRDNGESEQTVDTTHPCCRMWGSCRHGPTCLFRRAPSDLCLEYLMGLCDGAPCPLLHQQIYHLPPSTPRPDSFATHESDAAWERWVAERKKSANSAEWQLWNNGPLDSILSKFMTSVSSVKDGESASPVDTVHIDLTDVLSALHSIDPVVNQHH